MTLALVTGSSRGIGKEIALALAQDGSDIIVNYKSSEAQANQVVKAVRAMGRNAVALKADLSSVAEIERLRQEIADRFDAPVSILVNNAGIAQRQSWQAVTEQDWDLTVNSNLKSAFFVTQAFLPQMIEHGWGRIVFIASIAARTGGIVGPHYAASKAGLLGLMHYFAQQGVEHGVTVNALAPGLIDTDMAKGLKEFVQRQGAVNPMGRLGTPGEIAEACRFVTRSGFMTGQTIQIDGGIYFT